MSRPIAIFAYDFPHRKTNDFLMDLLAMGISNVVVLAAPRKELTGIDRRKYFPSTKKIKPAHDTRTLCENLGVQYLRTSHNDLSRISDARKKYGFVAGLITGARIIPAAVIDIFPDGIVNFHPGKLPETAGLDAFYYTVLKNCAPGTTTHFIDSRVDAGHFIRFDRALVTSSSSPEAVIENVYQSQRVALQSIAPLLIEGSLSASGVINRPSKNRPMTVEEKLDVLTKFPEWRARQSIEQLRDTLFDACRLGDIDSIQQVLSIDIHLLHECSSKGWTPLITACWYQQKAVVELLLRHGANPNQHGWSGITPISCIAMQLRENRVIDNALVESIVAAGADISLNDRHGKTIKDYAKQTSNRELLNILDSKKV